MGVEKDKDNLKGTPALAGVPSVGQRSDQQSFADSGSEEAGPGEVSTHDISTILMGAQAISGKAVTSAARMTVSPQQQQLDAQRPRNEQQAREQASLARWNGQMTTVGGVQMTNEQAQNARQNVIDNDDAYADWAVRKGLISEDDKEAFKTGIRRKKELEDKRGRGTLTPQEAAEEERLDHSRAGAAIEAATAYDAQHRGQAPAPEATADSRLRSPSATTLDRSALFQSAPDANAAFNAASKAEPPPPPPPSMQPIDRTIKATGLDL